MDVSRRRAELAAILIALENLNVAVEASSLDDLAGYSAHFNGLYELLEIEFGPSLVSHVMAHEVREAVAL